LQNPGSYDSVEKLYRIHEFQVTVNGISFNRVRIDTHYEEKHKAVINDEIILELVKLLDHGYFMHVDIDEDGFKYFVNDDWYLNGKPYRLVWGIPQDEVYLGVRNAFRRRSR